MPDTELEQIYRDIRFMLDACGESRRVCQMQRERLTAQRERVSQSCARQVEWQEKRAREDERLYESLTKG